MAFLSRSQIKAMAGETLHAVADFDGDIENYEFKYFQELQKNAFLTRLKTIINESPYYNRAGTPDSSRYYDVSLSLGLLNTWDNMADCINYVEENQVVRKK